MPTDTLIHEMTLGPLTAVQRADIMTHATALTPEARRTFRRLLRGADLAEIDAAWQELVRQATAQLEVEASRAGARACAARVRCTTRGRAMS